MKTKFLTGIFIILTFSMIFAPIASAQNAYNPLDLMEESATNFEKIAAILNHFEASSIDPNWEQDIKQNQNVVEGLFEICKNLTDEEKQSLSLEDKNKIYPFLTKLYEIKGEKPEEISYIFELDSQPKSFYEIGYIQDEVIDKTQNTYADKSRKKIITIASIVLIICVLLAAALVKALKHSNLPINNQEIENAPSDESPSTHSQDISSNHDDIS